MYCPNCGAENGESSAFCRECGFALQKADQNAATETAPSVSITDEYFATDTKITIMLAIIAMLTILAPIMWWMMPIRNTENVMGISLKITVPMFAAFADDALILLIVLVSLLSIASFIVTLLMFKNTMKYRRLILCKISSVLSLLMCIVAAVVVSNHTYYGITVSPFVLAAMVFVVALVLEFIVSATTKKLIAGVTAPTE